ncbi:MAG: S41 family peptidase [Cyclobacteriaceae bacterium]
MKKYCFHLILIFFCSCDQLLLEEDPENSLVQNFEIFWREFDRHYAFLELKELDWDSVYQISRPKVESFTSEAALFNLLEEIVLSLEDGHVNLYSNTGTVSYDFTAGFPANSPEHVINYLENISQPNNKIIHADLKNTNLGYFRVGSFGGDRSSFEVIDEIIKRFEQKEGIIIDVRSNSGGSDTNGGIIASRFADRKRLHRRFKYRNGPGATDFTTWFDDHVEPDGLHFSKPVVVLTNRGCFSSTEDFILAMRILPHVQVVGGITGGGSGNPIIRELPNGWLFRLSTWVMATPDFETFEEIGLAPDVSVTISEEDAANQKDTILEEAIALID